MDVMSSIFTSKANAIFHKKSDFQLLLSIEKWFANMNLTFIRISHSCCVYLHVMNENICSFISISDTFSLLN
jgi:hypothetical protein